ncbi:MAG: cytochrome c3 family protein [Pseudomonadota bacterium]
MKARRFCFFLTVIFTLTIFSSLISPSAHAKVTGPCANCHTMHNSQNGSLEVTDGPLRTLLKNDCLGCHSSEGTETVVSTGGSEAPIVLNHGLPNRPLAGGNFHWVEHGGDEYGHNVINPDGTLAEAPGNGGVGCGFGGCHASLASIRYAPGPGPLFNPIRGKGCIGCHDTRAAHHAGGQEFGNGYRLVGVPGDGTRGYRFLSKAGQVYWNIPPHNPPNVAGLEAPWAALQSQSSSAHNEYQDAPKAFAPNAYYAHPKYAGQPQGISDFCSGCHRAYHSWQDGGSPNGGNGSAWLRHPASVTLPDSGEYANYTVFDPTVPVARPWSALFGMTAASPVVNPGQDKVMCLSCHYAHAGPYPDALRWDYEGMIVGSDNPSGCFRCHSQKGQVE